MENKEVKFGNKPKDVFDYVKLGLLFKGSIDLVSSIPGVQKEKVFNFVDKVQQSLGLDVLNDYIIKDPELLNYRIRRIVNQAIQDHENQSSR